MLDAALTGVWAASRPALFDTRWVPAAPAITEHFFLVVSQRPDGSLEAFVRNPEHNAGAFFGTRSMTFDGSRIVLTAAKRDGAVGIRNADGTLTLSKIDEGGKDLRFHRATETDFRWFYPSAATSWTYRQPANTGDGWRTGTLRSAGMSEAPIASLIDEVEESRTPSLKSPYIHSIAIERHGSLVLDQYFYGFSADKPHDVRSAGKSVTTLMVGRAIEDTRAFSAASRVLPLLPQYSPIQNMDSRKAQMTVENLMTMASGLACDDNDDSSPGNEDTMQSRPAGTDWYRYTLDLPMLSVPGTRALYCSAGINLLGAIVQTETRAALDRYFDDRFAAPMHFGPYAMWLMPPPASAAYMGGGDYFRPRDFLKFGELMLRSGRWYGRRIVDESWIARSVRPRTAPEGEGDLYGYGWHLLSIPVDGSRYDVINAGGNGGQLLIVVPKLDVAIMVTAGNYNQFPVWRRFLPDVTAAVVRSCAHPEISRRS